MSFQCHMKYAFVILGLVNGKNLVVDGIMGWEADMSFEWMDPHVLLACY